MKFAAPGALTDLGGPQRYLPDRPIGGERFGKFVGDHMHF